jgi:hypothetical protein
VAGCCAPGARRSWHVSVRFGKRSHLERVETIGSIREVLGWPAGCTTGLQKDGRDGESKGSCRLLALPSQNRNMLCGPPYTPAMPCEAPPSDHSSVNSASSSMLPLSCRETHRSCKALRPVILRFYAGRCPSAATISPSLSTTIGRSQYPFSIVGEAAKS